MKKILFQRSSKANLPEIEAYIDYIEKNDSSLKCFDSEKMSTGDYDLEDFDLIWKFMGFDRKVNKRPVIHEYVSLSTGRFPIVKNKIKKVTNAKPDLRIFLNEDVKKEMNFIDNVPQIYRDMGIRKDFFFIDANKIYTFVYIGDISKERGIDKFLSQFVKYYSNEKDCLLLIGSYEKSIYEMYKDHVCIEFLGKVSQKQVIESASKASYGLNIIPDRYPYNIQTSTKLLEYMALGLKVITTDYDWVNKFEKENNCSFFKLDKSFENIRTCKEFEYENKLDIKKLEWSQVLLESNIIEAIKKII